MAAPQARQKSDASLPLLDYPLLLSAIVLLVIGLVMVGSASVHVADKLTGEPFYFLFRHVFALGLGLFLACLCGLIPMQLWQKAGGLLFVAGLLMLALVLVPGIGREVNGSVRWIPLGGFNLQPSEFAKLFVVVYIAGYLVRRQDEVVAHWKGFVKPMAVLTLPAILILLEPDFGTTAVLMATAMGMLFLGGVPMKQFAVVIGAGLASVVALVMFSPYRLQRITAYLDPWADPFNSGFQLTQALIAFGRGEWLGVGLGNSIQKQFYLPEAHTDFLYAVIGEELGVLGGLLVIGLFVFMVWRIFQIGATAEHVGKRFEAYVAYGIGLWLGMQSFINMGVNTGLLPTKGITLPFMSYGGNSIMVACMIIALVLRIDHENRKAGYVRMPVGAAWAA